MYETKLSDLFTPSEFYMLEHKVISTESSNSYGSYSYHLYEPACLFQLLVSN